MKTLTLLFLLNASMAFSQEFESLQWKNQNRYASNKFFVAASCGGMAAASIHTGSKARFKQPFEIMGGVWIGVGLTMLADAIMDKIELRKAKKIRSTNKSKYYAGNN